MNEEESFAPLSELWGEFKRRMEVVFRPQATIIKSQGIVRHLENFILDKGFDKYSPSIGQGFLTYLSDKVTSKTLEFYRLTVNHLDGCLSEKFWVEEYQLKNYLVQNAQLLELHEKLQADYDLFDIKKAVRNYSSLTIKRLDIFMRENNYSEYSPDVGNQFLECMESASNYSADLFSDIYRVTIRRINTFYVGERPFQIHTTGYRIRNAELKKNLDILLDRFKEKEYSVTKIRMAKIIIAQLDNYMINNSIDAYCPKVGDGFLACYNHHLVAKGANAYSVSIIAHFNDVFLEKPFQRYHRKKTIEIPAEYKDSFEFYRKECIENGNAPSTMKSKFGTCARFFSILKQLGVSDISEITSEAVIESCTRVASRDWTEIRGYLHCCATHELTARDYSLLVPHRKQPLLLPPYYTKEERQRLEKAPDRTTPIGKRDYAIVLLANRLGLRSSDIVNLGFSELRHDEKTIDFVQFKTKSPHSLPLLDEVEQAVADYVKDGRPVSDSDKIFLSSFAPYEPLGRCAIHAIITKCFMQAGVDVSNRKHGAHALRASLNSDLVNNGFTYEEASIIAGHKDRNTMKHYANLDIKHLRFCAVRPYVPTGNFKDALGIK